MKLFLRIAALVVAILTPPLSAIAPAAAQGHTEQRTPSGLPFAYRYDDTTPFSAVNFGWQDPHHSSVEGKAALYEILERAVPHGRMGEEPLREKLLDIGANVRFSFSPFYVIATIKAPHAAIGKALVSSVISLRYDVPEPLAFEQIIQALKGREADEAGRAEVAGYRTLVSSLVPGHPLLRGFSAGRHTLVAIEDLAAWRARTLDRANVRIVVSGKLTAAEAANHIDAAFAGLPERRPHSIRMPTNADAPPLAGVTIVIERNTPQIVIVMGGIYRRLHASHPEVISLSNACLGDNATGRLRQAIRDNLGATYTASSRMNMLDPAQSLLLLTAAVDPAKGAQSIAAMRQVYAGWRKNGCTEAEVARLVSAARSSRESDTLSPDGANSPVLNALLASRSLADVNAYDTRLSSVTTAEIRETIAAIFPESAALVTVVVAPSAKALREAGIKVDCTVMDHNTDLGSCRRAGRNALEPDGAAPRGGRAN